MAKSDIIASLKLNSTDYEQKLAKAKESTRKFSKDGGKGLEGMVGKFKGLAVAVAGSKAVMETFNAVIKSSQTIGDEYTRVVDSMKTSTNKFFYSIGSGDWTAFFNGLDDVIAKSRAASRAIDDLGTYDIALGYFREKYQTGFKESVASAKDTKNSNADRKAAAEAATQYAESYAKALDGKETLVRDAFAKILANAGSNIDASKVSIERFERVLEDAVLKGNASAYDKDYKEYQSLMEEKRRLEIEATTAANDATRVEYARRQEFTDKAIRLSQQAAEIERRLQAEKYQDAQMYNVALVQWTDDELKGHLATASGIEAGRREVAEMRTALIEVTNAMAKLGTTTATVVAKTKELKTSLTGEQYAQSFGVNFYNTLGNTLAGKAHRGYMPLQDVPIIDENTESSLSNAPVVLDKITESSFTAADGIGALGDAIGSIGGALDEGAGKWVNYASNIITSIAQAIPALEALTLAEVAANPWKVATGIAAIASMAAAFAQLPKFATGGVVPGNALSGDNVLIRANSGEVVLTKQQANNIGSALAGLGGNVRFVIEGDKLVGVLNNHNSITSRSYGH